MRTGKGRPLMPGEERVVARVMVIGAVAVLLLLGSPLLQALWGLGYGTARQAGWATPRCFLETSFGYDPRRDAPDRAFLAEPPEQVVATMFVGRDVVIERVEVNHRAHQAVVRARLRGAEGREDVREFRLSAGTFREVYVDTPRVEQHVCDMHLGGWRLSGE